MNQVTGHAFMAIDDAWRTWIAENLMLGAPPAVLVHALAGHGFAAQAAHAEVDAALRSPYLRGAERLKRRLAKRDWVLDIQRKLNRLRPTAMERCHRLDAQTFLERHYGANRPVIITGMMDDWPAMRRWSLDHFRGAYGDREVEVRITLYFTDREPAGPYKVKVGARRTNHVRMNLLDDPEPVPLGQPFSTVVEADGPVVVQLTRLDSRQAENALLSVIAFAG